jgi:hypothetical protein
MPKVPKSYRISAEGNKYRMTGRGTSDALNEVAAGAEWAKPPELVCSLCDEEIDPEDTEIHQCATARPWYETYAWPTEPFLVSVDPGDVHCGVAFFIKDEENEHGFRVFLALEMEPDDFTDMLAWLIIRGKLNTVVYERFRLYADKAEEQKGSEFATSQLIGVIRWMVRKQNEHAKEHVQWRRTNTKMTCESDSGCGPGRLPVPVTLVGQMADIKKPARGILRFKKIKSQAILNRVSVHEGHKMCSKERCHAVDAELHGWHWLLKGHARDITERPRVDARHIQAGV